MELDRFLDNLPLGVDTNVGVNGNKLSGGQRQIIWVLKAFLINPEIVIMDEPTAAVDEKTKEIIHYLLEKIVNKKTVIMITHDPYLLKFAKRIITLENGIVVKDTREGEGQGQGQGQQTLEKNPLLKQFQHRLISRPW
jgi:ABC-type bacteriocin/lantibiotic exporter with double-glycine peptidase domain